MLSIVNPSLPRDAPITSILSTQNTSQIPANDVHTDAINAANNCQLRFHHAVAACNILMLLNDSPLFMANVHLIFVINHCLGIPHVLSRV